MAGAKLDIGGPVSGSHFSTNGAGGQPKKLDVDAIVNEGRVTLDEPSFLETALYYAKNGWHVSPLHTPIFQDDKLAGCSCGKADCASVGKHPRTAKGKDNATTDEKIIIRWWSLWPDANIGLNCGASGLVAIDFDIHKEGYAGGELLDKLRSEHPTTTAKSGSDGFHLFYQQPKDNPL